MSPRGPTRRRPEPSDATTYTDRDLFSQKEPLLATKATSAPSGDQPAVLPAQMNDEVIPCGVNRSSPPPSASTTNRSRGSLSPVSRFVSGRKNRNLLPSGEKAGGAI